MKQFKFTPWRVVFLTWLIVILAIVAVVQMNATMDYLYLLAR